MPGNPKRICIIVGTRPEIIKMAPVIRACQNRGLSFFVIHSNQHYSREMDAVFFEELCLPKPDYNLSVGSALHGNQTGNILIKIEPILLQEKPDLVMVQGDTNTVLAGALAASKMGIPVAHVEAGLRSYDKAMPEETNRVLTDHMSDYLFAVAPRQEQILLKEGIDGEKIHVVGNTVSDSLFQHLALPNKGDNLPGSLDLQPKEYFLVTAHRASNVDIKAHLIELLALLDRVHARFDQPFVWPMHPRTRKKIDQYELEVPDYLDILPPVGYFDFIQLQQSARLILTDSGGIQEEACLLGVPCITLRENTERPESIDVGANILVGRDADKAVAAAETFLESAGEKWKNPFGDGTVAQRIIDIVTVSGSEARKEKVTSTVAVIGQGYMGLPIACLLADCGHQVTGVDLDPKRVQAINAGECPFDEKALPELLDRVINSGRLKARQAVPSSDAYLIAVPTPQKNKSCDSSMVLAAADAILEVASDGQLVIIESTVSPGTSKKVLKLFEAAGLDIDLVHCPERAIPGATLHELVTNDRIIGADAMRGANKAKLLYQSFVAGEIFSTDLVTAECVKLVENTSRDVGIAFANELAAVCKELDVDVRQVIELANRHPRVDILSPGAGVGGHCIPIDPWFLVESSQAGTLIRLARRINDERPIAVANQAIEAAKKVGALRIGLLGVAYKPNVDDTRETPALPIGKALENAGYEVRYHDPLVSSWQFHKVDTLDKMKSWADLLIVVTSHSCYDGLLDDIQVIDPGSA